MWELAIWHEVVSFCCPCTTRSVQLVCIARWRRVEQVNVTALKLLFKTRNTPSDKRCLGGNVLFNDPLNTFYLWL